MKIPVTRPDEKGLAIIAAQSERLDRLVPLERAAQDYAAAVWRHEAAQLRKDEAFEKVSKSGTYGNVQAWHESIDEMRTAAAGKDYRLGELARAAVELGGAE